MHNRTNPTMKRFVHKKLHNICLGWKIRKHIYFRWQWSLFSCPNCLNLPKRLTRPQETKTRGKSSRVYDFLAAGHMPINTCSFKRKRSLLVDPQRNIHKLWFFNGPVHRNRLQLREHKYHLMHINIFTTLS